MTYTVAVRKNETGEVRMCAMDFEWFKEDGYTDMFWWTEGNYSCDCNRYLCFQRAKDEDEDDDVPCGETAYTALYADLPDGTRITIDDA